MARSVFDARQTIIRQFLEQLAKKSTYDGTTDAKPAQTLELDNLLSSINKELTVPLRIDATDPVSLQINVGAAIVSNTESDRNKAIPPIAPDIHKFTGGTITFPSSSGGTVTVVPGNDYPNLTISNSNYLKCLIYLDKSGSLNILPGQEDPIESNATVFPAPSGTLPIGYVTIFADATGVIQSISQSSIYQFGSGAGGGSGTGNANSFIETLKNRLNDSVFQAVTPIVFSIDEDKKIDTTLSTGSYDVVTSNFKFANASELLVTKQLLDSEFLADVNTSVSKAELIVAWDPDNLDTAATYEISRDGGTNWQAVTMDRVSGSVNTYRGIHEFSNETTLTQLSTQTTVGGAQTIGTTTPAVGQKYTTVNKTLLREVILQIDKVGTPSGHLIAKIVKDNGTGLPSTNVNDILWEDIGQIYIPNLTAGTNTITLQIPDVIVGATTDVHLVLEGDSTYLSSFVLGTTEVDVKLATGGAGLATFDGTTWTAGTGSIYHDLKGFELDLRARIASSVGNVYVEGLGVFYEELGSPAQIINGESQLHKVVFKAVTDNLDTFTMPFLPNADFLKVYFIEGGQVFKYPAFDVQGYTVKFAPNTFQNAHGGADDPVTLIFDQSTGGYFDNSDKNALLLAANHLGSTDPAIDRSSPGRGIILRGPAPDAKLFEISVDNSGNIIVTQL